MTMRTRMRKSKWKASINGIILSIISHFEGVLMAEGQKPHVSWYIVTQTGNNDGSLMDSSQHRE